MRIWTQLSDIIGFLVVFGSIILFDVIALPSGVATRLLGLLVLLPFAFFRLLWPILSGVWLLFFEATWWGGIGIGYRYSHSANILPRCTCR